MTECRLLVKGGGKRIDSIIDEYKSVIYEYNTRISGQGYYLKPVHKVYRRLSDGTLKVYEYYGRYYWRKAGERLIYAGREKPRGLPDIHLPFEGLAVIRINNSDVVIDCDLYDKFKHIFEGLHVERY